VFVGGGPRDTDGLGRVLDREAREGAQLDQLSPLRVLGGEAGQGRIDVEEMVVRRRVADVGVI
jgi:hypothetical protein